MLAIDPKFEQKIKQAYVVWFTTVRADGMPQPTPVWFIWENGTFVIYSKPNAQKLRNIRRNPKVALNFNTDDEASEYLVIMGVASMDARQVSPDRVPAYMEKYRQGIQDLGYTLETFAKTWSVAIRVQPTFIRAE